MSKPKILMILNRNGSNGGPFVSHMRICNSGLKRFFLFECYFYDKSRQFINPSFVKKFCQDIKKIKPDIVQIAGLQPESYLISRACKKAKVKHIVVVVHGSSREAEKISALKKFFFCYLEKKALSLCDFSYGVSNYVSNWPVLRDNDKYFGTIYNLPFNDYDSSFSSKTSNIREEFSISKDAFVVVSTGRITVEKGYKTVCDIVKKIRHKDIVFLIVGSGNYLNEMKEELSSYKNIFFTGFRSDIPSILKQSNLFLSCTKHETLGNSIFEALSSDIPVVATDVGGVPELVINNQNGYLVGLNDADAFCEKIENLYEKKDLYKKFVSNCKLIYETINPDDIEQKLISFYSKVLETQNE